MVPLRLLPCLARRVLPPLARLQLVSPLGGLWHARAWNASTPRRRSGTLTKLRLLDGRASTRPSAAAESGVSTLTAADLLPGAQLSDAPQAPPSQPVVLVLSGPSGVGKDAVVRQLQARRPAVRFVVTATTRPKRPGEQHGVDYLFVSRPDFDALIQRDELLEHALVYGEYKGIPKSQVRDALAGGHDVVLRLDVQGAATMRRLLPGAVFVFLVAESDAALAQRLMSRKTEPPDKLRLRVVTARDETRRMGEFDYVVVNSQGKLDAAVDALCSIMDAERCRVHRTPLPQL